MTAPPPTASPSQRLGQPSVSSTTSAGARARVAKQILRLATRSVPVDIALPDGGFLTGRDTSDRNKPRIDLHRPGAFYAPDLADSPKIGIGEAYTAGDWSAGRR